MQLLLQHSDVVLYHTWCLLHLRNCLCAYAAHHFVTCIKVWLMPKRSWQYAWSHDNRTSRVNYTDKFAAIRTITSVLVQSCQQHKHRQWVEPLCHCECGDGESASLYTLCLLWDWSLTLASSTHGCVMPLHCGWVLLPMHNIRACF
jgi:hypothetical protein